MEMIFDSCTIIQILCTYYFTYHSNLFFQIKTQEKDSTIQTAFQRILKHKKSSNFQKHFKLCENGLIHIIFKFISNTKLPVVFKLLILRKL